MSEAPSIRSARSTRSPSDDPPDTRSAAAGPDAPNRSTESPDGSAAPRRSRRRSTGAEEAGSAADGRRRKTRGNGLAADSKPRTAGGEGPLDRPTLPTPGTLRCDTETECRHVFLATASAQLSTSLDPETTLKTIAALAVPTFADWAAVDILTGEDRLKRIAAVQADPEGVELVRSIERLNRDGARPAHGARRAIRTGQTDFVPEVTDEILREVAIDDRHLEALRKLRPRSFICVPMLLGERVLGAITLVFTVSDRRYEDADREMFEDLAGRAAIALDNAATVAELRDARRRLEEQAHQLEERTRQLESARQRLELNVQQTPLGVIDTDGDGHIIGWNPGAERLFGYSADEVVGQPAEILFYDKERFRASLKMLHHLHEPVRRGAVQNVTKDGTVLTCAWYAIPIVDERGEPIGVSAIVEDMTEHKRMEEEASRQMARLGALRAIDMAITASVELSVVLTVLLDQVVAQLDVDAADILIVNKHSNRLRFSVGRGFRTSGIQETVLSLGEGFPGRAWLERRTISVPTYEAHATFVRYDLLAAEEFVSYYCTPIVSRGSVSGVLEVFSRRGLRADQDWINYFEILAGEAAVAIDSAQLFTELQKSNLDLTLAYDSTLEGWAKALDLRDNVTEGHSRRVTEMTERMAREIGIPEPDIVHIRRGALLHDIGKMGIPDSVLKKDGPLTDEEWNIMRKHPMYAEQLLSQIDYLRPAMDIPAAHHERWDGSGYPRGLRGKEIPLAARIFAIVDVWDALTSDRSYRDAWTRDRAREHIHELAGTQLDPELVDVFLRLDW